VPHAHALLILATAILLAGTGIVMLALAWRRGYRGERSAMVVGRITPGQRAVSLVGVPAVGLTAIFGIALAASVLR
jgi:hypothetical protein